MKDLQDPECLPIASPALYNVCSFTCQGFEHVNSVRLVLYPLGRRLAFLTEALFLHLTLERFLRVWTAEEMSKA